MEAAKAEPPILFDMAIKVVGKILADSHPAKPDQLPWSNRFKPNPSFTYLRENGCKNFDIF